MAFDIGSVGLTESLASGAAGEARAGASYWFGRFKAERRGGDAFWLRDHLLPSGRLLPAGRFVGLSGRDRALAFFSAGFAQPALGSFPQPVADAPANEADLLFWQFPCRTEGVAWDTHAQIGEAPLVGDSLHCYVGLPWATWIDKQRVDQVQVQAQHQVALLQVRLSGLRGALQSLGVKLRVHTVCQHIYWREMAATWRRLGVTDVWLSHLPRTGLRSEVYGFDVHPWALYAVNVEDAERRRGLTPGIDPGEKSMLASFVGAYSAHYLGDARLRLRALADEPGFHVRVTDKWHFEDVVYQHQVQSAPLAQSYRVDDDVASYNRLLSGSRFSLCPVGAGPNTLRLWESLAVGSVPVMLGPQPEWPRGGNLPAIDWDRIVVTVADDDIPRLPQILRAMPLDEVRRRQKEGMAAYERVRQQRCF